MLKSEAVHAIQRAMEETGATFSEEQIQALAILVLKIANEVVSEALSEYRPGTHGPR